MLDIKKQKTKLLEQICTKNCCGLAFLLAVFKSGISTVCPNEGKIYIKNTDKNFIKKLSATIAALYQNQIEIIVQKGRFMLMGQSLIQMLLDCCVIERENNFFKTTIGIDQKLLEEECCKITFLKTIFYCAGSFYFDHNLKQNTKGYSLEFAFKELAVIDDVQALLEHFSLKFSQYKKNNNIMLYSKNSENIFNFFVIIDAVELSLLVQNNLALRNMRNEINRQSNCYEANINKTINASFAQIKAIEYLIKNNSFEMLENDLKEIALLRLENKEASLIELQSLLKTPVTRAGLKYKLDKIIKIYKSLKG